MTLTQISTAGVKDDAVTAGKIPANAVGSSELADNAVDTAAIAADAVTGAKIADDAVAAEHIADNGITNAHINSSAAIAGSKISPDFGSQNITTTGAITATTSINTSGNLGCNGQLQVVSSAPEVILTDTNANSDYSIVVNTGQFRIRDETNSANRLAVNSDGHVDIYGNLDVGAGIDCTGTCTATSFAGDGSNLTGITSTTINNNADNRVITGSGTANTLNGEANVNIDSSGRLLIATNTASGASTNADDLKVGSESSGSQRGITIGSAIACNIRFADAADDTAGAIIYNHSNNDITFTAGSSARASIDADGLKFGTDSAAANALNDYEEGSWTPTMSNTGSLSNGVASGRYTKVGRMVHFVAKLTWSGRSNNGGYNITFGSLPFTAASYFQFPIYVGGSEGFSDNNSGNTHIGGSVIAGNSTGQFRVSSSTGSNEISFNGSVGATNAGYIYWGGTYYIN